MKNHENIDLSQPRKNVLYKPLFLSKNAPNFWDFQKKKKIWKKKKLCHRICSFSKKKSGRLEQYRERYREITSVRNIIIHSSQLKKALGLKGGC